MADPVPSLSIFYEAKVQFPPDFTVFLLILTGFSWNFPVFMDHKRGGGGGKMRRGEREGKIPQVCWRMIVKWEEGVGGGEIRGRGIYFISPNFGGKIIVSQFLSG